MAKQGLFERERGFTHRTDSPATSSHCFWTALGLDGKLRRLCILMVEAAGFWPLAWRFAWDLKEVRSLDAAEDLCARRGQGWAWTVLIERA